MSDIVERLARLSPQQRTALLRVIDTDGQRFGIAPLSYAQQRLWLLDRFDPGNAAWHVSGVREIEGDLDAAALQAAIGDLVARHAALRTAFHVVDGVPIQSLATPPAPALARFDVTDRPEAEREAAAVACGCTFADAPFDLARPPLLRAALIRLAPRRHWLVLAIHHIACDMVSLGVIQRELIALYDAHRRGEAPALPAATHSYTDFARAQREPAARAAHDASIARWTQRLAGAPAQLDLPTDLPRRAAQGSRGGAAPFTLTAATNAALREAAQAAGATPVMAYLAVYAALLGKLAGQDDVVIGSPVSNRSHTRWNGIVGFFLNTLLLRIDLSGAPDFRELLRRTRETCIAAYADADAPFERLVDALQPGRQMSHRPLFQALFVHQNRPPAQETAAGLLWRHVDLPIRTMVADIGLWTVEAPGACEGFVAYDADLILPSTARRFGDRYACLAGELLRAPSRPVHRLSPLPREERTQIAAWTAGPVREDDDVCLHELVAAQAQRTPDACAIAGDEGELTYRELHTRARALAAQLTARGIGPDRRVAVMLERSHALVVALVSVLYAGGAYVPLDPSYPAERLRYMLQDSGAAVLLSDARAGEALGATAMPSLLWSSAGAAWQAVGGESVDTAPANGSVTPDHLAYVIYTSGSTGRPKGAMNAHRAVVNRLRWMQRDYGFDASDRILQKTPSSFDVSVWEFFLPLICGATLVLARPEGHKDPAYLAGLIARERVTTLHFVPSMFAAFLDRPELESLTSLRRVFLSGEALPRELAQRFAARSRAGLHNLYGPTEAAVDVSAWDCADGESGPVPIGRPVANTTLHVLDRDLAPVPVGVPGELYIGGVQVGRGYLGRAALTAERFLPDPAGPPGARLYRTGDRARWRHDGALDYLGRNDHQVKIRGFRIEPGEIDDALAQCRDVERAAVVARTAASGESLLVAYVQPRRDAATDRAYALAVVRDWAAVHDEMYAAAAADPTFDTSSWNSSYDDGPIPEADMRDYVAARVETITALQPRRVLEVGCGTGLLLLRLAPHCERYVGTDISRVALAKVSAAMDANPAAYAGVELLQRDALDTSCLPDGAFDVVVMNSVCHLFPDQAYLADVLDGLARIVAPGGCIFVGDARRLDVQRAFHATVQQHRGGGRLSREALRERIDAAVAREAQLVVGFEFFDAWARRAPQRSATIELERGRRHNEFTRFRYDALLRVGAGPRGEPRTTAVWDDGGGVAALSSALARTPGGLRVGGIPNARLQQAAVLLRHVDDGAAMADTHGGVEPDDLHALAAQHGFALSLRPAADGCIDHMDAVFLPPHGADEAVPANDTPATPVESWSNDPLRASIVDALTRRLTDALRAQLPAHMVPDRFVFLDRLPLSPSGKIDRLALPPLECAAPTRAEPPLAPRDAVERRLAAIWRELLGVETVGVRDNFFALGGQSILAARLMARIQGEFDRALPLALLFDGATIEFLAQRLADGERAPGRALVPIRPRGPDDTLTPFFCIHAGGGNVIAYQALAEAMATSSPRAFYALQAIGIDGTQPPLEGFGAMAERYIEEIRSVQPQGPYLIGGWCTGGRLAQEIVRRLEASGETVSVLALFDAIATPLGLPDGETLDDAGLLASMSPAFAAAAASVASGPKEEWLARLVARLRDDGAIPPEARVDQIRDMLVVFRAILRAERSHRPQPCAAPIVQFRALEQPGAWLSRDLGWRRFARGGVAVVDVPGNHLSMMEIRSNVDALARALNTVLDAPAQVAPPGFAAILRDRFLNFVLALRARFDPRLR